MTIQAPADTVMYDIKGNIIASLDDGFGRVVYDVSFARAFDNYAYGDDNEIYFSNVARWLAHGFEGDIDVDGIADSLDNCISIFNPDQEDYDLDGIGDSCDPCNNFKPEIVYPGDTVTVQFNQPFGYYPEITDNDDSVFTISYTGIPHWCSIQNDSVVGITRDTIFFEPITAIVEDTCNADTVSFMTLVYLCGNVNNDIYVNIFDITYLIAYLYMEGDPPDPIIAGDVNDDGTVNIFDITYLIAYLYMNGPDPACP